MEFIDRGESHPFYQHEFGPRKKAKAHDPRLVVKCLDCDQTTVRREIITGEARWSHHADGWVCPDCKEARKHG